MDLLKKLGIFDAHDGRLSYPSVGYWLTFTYLVWSGTWKALVAFLVIVLAYEFRRAVNRAVDTRRKSEELEAMKTTLATTTKELESKVTRLWNKANFSG